MLTEISIQNFQPHKSRTIPLSQLVSVTGPSDRGKSSILRALRWLVTNKPGGDTFIREGADDCAVTLKLDGREIKRSKGKGGNKYWLDGKELVAFGTDVPPDITKLLNLTENNFQGQHDSPFWFGASAGEVSRQLNQIINLGVIDSTLANLNAGIRESTSRVNLCTERLETAKTDRDRLKPIAEVSNQLQVLEEQEKALLELSGEADLLNDLLQEVAKHQTIRQNAVKGLESGLEAIRLGAAWKDVADRRVKLGGLVENIRNLTQTAQQVVPDLAGLEALAERVKEAAGRRWSLRGLLDEAQTKVLALTKITGELAESTITLRKAMGASCPLCGQPLKDAK